MVESSSVEVRCSRCLEVLESVAGVAVVEDAPILCYALFCASCAQALASVCPECGRECPEDERVAGGMKCGNCAYPGTNNETVDEAK